MNSQGISEDLPEGWTECTVADLVDIGSGDFLHRSEYQADDSLPYPVAGAGGPIGWCGKWNQEPPCLVLGRVGAAGTLRVYRERVWATDNTLVVHPRLEGLFGFLSSYFRIVDWSPLRTGSSQPLITQTAVKQLVVPLPPLAEQERIVAKLETVLARVNNARERLARVPAILKRFRQSVLAAACSGRLTADWREQHPDVEPALSIVERITHKRKTQSSKAPLPEVVDSGELPDVPAEWIYVCFGTVIGELRNGISTKPNIDPPGENILRISSARPGKVLLDDVRYLPDAEDLVNTYRLSNGDLLFTRYNGSIELLGVCGMVRGLGKRTVLYPDKLMRVRFDHNLIEPEYVELFFQVAQTRDRVTAKAKSSAGQQGVSGADIKGQALALPPLAEQREIIRRASALLILADTIETRIAQATRRAGKLTQSTLARAFRGELVPTEAELARAEGRPYESAAELLERIRRTRKKH